MRKACPRSLEANNLNNAAKATLKKAAGSQVDLRL